MTGIEHILSPISAGWASWLMLALMLCGVLAEYWQPGLITQAYHSLMAQSERTYKAAPNNPFGQAMVSIFCIGTWAMAVCLCLPTETSFRPEVFGVVCGVILAVLLLKMGCTLLLGYTFQLFDRINIAYEHYSNLTTLTAMVLYPGILVLLRVCNISASLWTIGIVTGVFVILWIVRSLRYLISSPTTLIYYLLYICSLEILPIAAVYYISKQLVLIL